MKPSVGRIVHYVAYGTPGGEFPSRVCRAAIITRVDIGDPSGFEVDLCVINPTGIYFNVGCRQDEGTHRPGTWHWPERID